jgi:ABC-type dipeptide/oligopeptide/nickel transport system permease subunit
MTDSINRVIIGFVSGVTSGFIEYVTDTIVRALFEAFSAI